jgi:hypothetical protein
MVRLANLHSVMGLPVEEDSKGKVDGWVRDIVGLIDIDEHRGSLAQRLPDTSAESSVGTKFGHRRVSSSPVEALDGSVNASASQAARDVGTKFGHRRVSSSPVEALDGSVNGSASQAARDVGISASVDPQSSANWVEDDRLTDKRSRISFWILYRQSVYKRLTPAAIYTLFIQLSNDNLEPGVSP